ncbi:MAG: inositol-3-phosphate synthase [Planctomycetota bacterium]
METTQSHIPQARRTGLWLVGAKGAIGTTVACGLTALAKGQAPATGVLTATPAFANLPWVPWTDWCLGGHDVCARTLGQSAEELMRAGVVPAGLANSFAAELEAIDARVQPGLIDGEGGPLQGILPASRERSQASPRERIAALQSDWQAFEAENGLAGTVVVYIASTEARVSPQACWLSLQEFEAALDRGDNQPASVLYAYAALASGRPFVNFTPNLGSQLPALRELAIERGVPHCGNDGKTGETLLKTSLAPMFHGRALRVLSWQGYNMLGNRDGEILKESGHREAKLANKDEALRSILQQDGALPNEGLHSHVAIDYVPSLGDWKTAWDFVHFEGFLGTRMSLQFTWAGSDSALAAPLVLDLARLAEMARRRGEKGVLPHTAAFFKAPLGGGSHDFHRQLRELEGYLQALAPLE